jgi:predicted TIM-barrel fold metal-dependent hydrolase
MMIIDSGVHIWLPEAPDRPWMPGRTAHLPEPLTYQKFSAMMDEAGVGHAILVPTSWEGERIDYSLEAAQKLPAIRHLQSASIADRRFFSSRLGDHCCGCVSMPSCDPEKWRIQ